MRILLVSQMYPGPEDPDLGTFVAQVERALAARGHEIRRAVLDRRAGGKRRYLDLARRARDVRNVGAIPGIRALTRFTVGRAAAVIAVSDYLRRELEAKVPEAREKTEVVDSGVDLERFAPRSAADGPP